jgi:hypothetical protein
MSFFVSNNFHYCGDDRENDYRYHQQTQVFADKFKFTEKVAEIEEERDPANTTNDVKTEEAGIVHVAHSADEWGKRPDYRDKTRDDNGLATVLFVKVVSFFEILLLENLGVGIAEQFLSEKLAYEIVTRIASNGGSRQQQSQQMDIEMLGTLRRTYCSQRSGSKQQRIAGQHGSNYQPCFAKNDQEQDAIHPYTVVAHQFGQVHINVENEIYEKFNYIHQNFFLLSDCKDINKKLILTTFFNFF